ncbi:hypothetical protein EP7_002072 [Isosphaeraceae bacterium EP7]
MTATPTDLTLVDAPDAGSSLAITTLTELPRDLGVLLLAMGMVGVAAPGVPGTPALLAACVVLWPEGFGWLEHRFARRFPRAHRSSLNQVTRFHRDVERRYPSCPRLN